MTVLIILWLSIGAGVNMFLHIKSAAQIGSILMSGPLGILVVLATGIVNHFIWPISLYLYYRKS